MTRVFFGWRFPWESRSWIDANAARCSSRRGFSSTSSIARDLSTRDVTSLFYDISLFIDTVPDGSLQYDQFSTVSIVRFLTDHRKWRTVGADSRYYPPVRPTIYTYELGIGRKHTFFVSFSSVSTRDSKHMLCAFRRYVLNSLSKVRLEVSKPNIVLVSHLEVQAEYSSN